MLFTSFQFIFVFLPVVFCGFFLLARFAGRQSAAIWLAATSVFFYGWWSTKYVPLLLGSIVFNYTIGYIISQNLEQIRARAKVALYFGVIGNILLLCYYKYSNFFLGEISKAAGLNLPTLELILPLGISFFTFTQVAFLVDAWRGKAREYNFWHYLLFVTWFPHLIAGPILHHGEMMPQFRDAKIYRARSRNIAVGLALFAFGLGKKLLLADPMSAYADPVFSAVAHGQAIGPLIAWTGALAYTLQIYFDFSGYSDMAVGLSLLFGIRLPINFNSPYKAQSIIEFWRRWHMTLSQFLRDYLYISLGGNRHGEARRLLNLLLTMLLGGLWHGAAWTFVAWGAIHGGYLCINHLYRKLPENLRLEGFLPRSIAISTSVAMTFFAVIIAWVFFRADSINSAQLMLTAMMGTGESQWMEVFKELTVPRFVAGASLSMIIVWFFPNMYEIIDLVENRLDFKDTNGFKIASALSIPTAIICSFIFFASLSSTFGVNVISPFIYFQF